MSDGTYMLSFARKYCNINLNLIYSNSEILMKTEHVYSKDCCPHTSNHLKKVKSDPHSTSKIISTQLWSISK